MQPVNQWSEQERQALLDTIVGLLPAATAYTDVSVVGSRAGGWARAQSDFDVIVIAPGPTRIVRGAFAGCPLTVSIKPAIPQQWAGYRMPQYSLVRGVLENFYPGDIAEYIKKRKQGREIQP